MAKVLVISGHPDLKISNANKKILEELEQKIPQVEIRKLDELYPDYQIDVDAEHEAWDKADIIIFQYPLHWYSVPAILKVYIDKVMTRGWAYGSKGKALVGKKFIASVTVGAPESKYSKDGTYGHEVKEFHYFIEGLADLCNLKMEKLFYSCNMMYVPGVSTEAHKDYVLETAKQQADDIAEFVEKL